MTPPPASGRSVPTMAERAPRHPDPEPMQTDDERVVLIGTVGWVLALVVLVVLRVTGATDVQDWWLGMCGYGIALGLFGMRYCQRRHAAIERDRARGVPQAS